MPFPHEVRYSASVLIPAPVTTVLFERDNSSTMRLIACSCATWFLLYLFYWFIIPGYSWVGHDTGGIHQGHETTYLLECANPLAPRLVDCSTSARFSVKRTSRNSASMHSVLLLETSCFSLLHSLQLRSVLRRRPHRCFAGLAHSLIELFFMRPSAVSKLFSWQQEKSTIELNTFTKG